MTHWTPGWTEFPQPLLDFWTERHLCTLTTLRRDGSPHVVPVGLALDPDQECAWIITRRGSQKVANVERAGEAGATVAVCQVDGGRWSTLEGRARLLTDADSVARACERYASRYREPQPNPERVAFRIEVDRFLHGPALAG